VFRCILSRKCYGSLLVDHHFVTRRADPQNPPITFTLPLTILQTMDSLKQIHTLLRQTARMFYTPVQIILFDILLKHAVLGPKDLSLLICQSQTQVQKDMAKLVLGGLVRPGVIPGPPSQKVRRGKAGYYIDYCHAVDAIKYRLFHLNAQVKGVVTNHEARYLCHQRGCEKTFSALDVMDLLGENGEFRCTMCFGPVELEQHVEGAKYDLLVAQLEPLVALLKVMEDIHMPERTFEMALAEAVPAFDDEGTKAPPVQSAVPHTEMYGVDFGEERKVEVEAPEKRPLPSWLTHSNVTGEHTVTRAAEQTPLNPTTEVEDTKPALTDADFAAIAGYYEAAKNAKTKELEDTDEEVDWE